MDLKPPREYESWLDYAIDTMETRYLYQLSCGLNGESPWGRVVQREEFRRVARAELERLRNMKREYRDCARQAAREAYDRELERW